MSGLSFAFARELFEAYLVEASYRRSTISGKLAYLKALSAYLDEAELADLREVTRERMVASRVTSANGRAGRRDGRSP